MQFDHLKLTGFKSFVDPTELDISSGLTGVVGPNGCGKSNLVEALRWVMGETSAKQMRGGEMDDVIFNGATTRPARNAAEVTLVVDNSERKAPASLNDAQELSVARRIERAKGSNYKVNGRDVRSRDVQLLFADAGTGARSAGIVNQGRVGALINAKPSERRILLEEAANIRGLYTRRHEAELRLKGAETNLERLEDLLNSVQAQLQGLHKQAKQAKRYRTINEQIRKSESILFHNRWLDVTAQKEKAMMSMREADEKVQNATQIAAKAARVRAEYAEKLPTLRRQEVEAAAALQSVNLTLNELQNELSRIDKARMDESHRLSQIGQDIEREQSLANEATVTVRQLNEERMQLTESSENEEEDQEAALTKLEIISKQSQELEDYLSKIMETIASVEAKTISLERQVNTALEREKRLDGQIEHVQTQLSEHGGCGKPEESIEFLEKALEKAEAIAKVSSQALEESDRKQAQQARLVDEMHSKLRNAAAQLVSLQAETESLRMLLSEIPANGVKPILDHLVVEPGYEIALSASLGDDLTAPVHADHKQVLKRFWSRIVAKTEEPSLPKGATALTEWVAAPAELQPRLRQIGVVADERTAEQLHSSLTYGQCLTSLEGGLWRWDGYVARGELENQSSIRIKQTIRLRELSVQLDEANELEKEANDALKKGTAELEQLDYEGQTARTDYKNAFEQLDLARKELSNAQRSSLELTNKMTRLSEMQSQLINDRNEAIDQRNNADLEIKSMQGRQILQSKSEKIRLEIAENREMLVDARSKYEELIRETRIRQSRLAVIREELGAWLERTRQAELRMNDLETRKNIEISELKRLENLPEEISEQKIQLQITRETNEKARKGAADKLAIVETDVLGADKSSKEADKCLGLQREDRVRAEAIVEQLEQALSALTERIRERLDCMPAEILEKAGIQSGQDIPDIEAIEARIERLNRERERIGPVNLRAELEVTELEERISSVETERDDLIGAIDRLRRAISSLNREGRGRLLKAFDAVNKHFQDLFVRLFGGGSAHLNLVEAEDPLDAGIEIMTSPPGKKLQTMSLLSGGEQALTALALIFAAFLTNPSPICILDEVDAPLDDSNVDRFCSLLTDLSKSTKTRFLIITHHRLTMARMDRLFGVTMAEQGVSQLVSVNLEGAEELRDRS